MAEDAFLDVDPDDPRWGHGEGPGVGGVRLHYIRQGQGDAVVLLHGWPGFWYDWRRLIPRLAGQADVIAPDLRGFGRSDIPDLPPEEGYNPVVMAGDVLALLDHLGIDRAVVVGHDIGATVAQAMARGVPERVRALALFNPPYLGIGPRRFEYPAQQEMWYQHLHVKPWAQDLVGYNRDTVRIYLSHFYDHWMGRKDALRPKEFEWIVDALARPGVVEGGFNYYRARMVAHAGEAKVDPKDFAIDRPTVVRWGDRDPVIPIEWSDRLSEFFPRSTMEPLPGVGHFVPFEAPDEAASAIREAMASR